MRRERRNRNRVPDNIIIAIHKDTGEHRIETVGFNTQKKGWGWPWVRKSIKVWKMYQKKKKKKSKTNVSI